MELSSILILHLVGFIIRMFHDAQSHDRKKKAVYVDKLFSSLNLAKNCGRNISDQYLKTNICKYMVTNIVYVIQLHGTFTVLQTDL
jgi:hypothetical protein